jgi:hypothetical protein
MESLSGEELPGGDACVAFGPDVSANAIRFTLRRVASAASTTSWRACPPTPSCSTSSRGQAVSSPCSGWVAHRWRRPSSLLDRWGLGSEHWVAAQTGMDSRRDGETSAPRLENRAAEGSRAPSAPTKSPTKWSRLQHSAETHETRAPRTCSSGTMVRPMETHETTTIPLPRWGSRVRSRRPLQRNRRSRCVRAGRSWWEPTKVPVVPSGSRPVHDFITHPGASGSSTAPPLGSERGTLQFLVQLAHDSYRSTPHELLGGRPATATLDGRGALQADCLPDGFVVPGRVLRRYRQPGRVGWQRTVGPRSAVPTTWTACSSARRGSERRTPMKGDRPA